MAIVTKAAKQRMADDAAWRQICGCGHPMPVHHEYRDSWEMRDGEMVRISHPSYKPWLFKCDECDCEVQR